MRFRTRRRARASCPPCTSWRRRQRAPQTGPWAVGAGARAAASAAAGSPPPSPRRRRTSSACPPRRTRLGAAAAVASANPPIVIPARDFFPSGAVITHGTGVLFVAQFIPPSLRSDVDKDLWAETGFFHSFSIGGGTIHKGRPQNFRDFGPPTPCLHFGLISGTKSSQPTMSAFLGHPPLNANVLYESSLWTENRTGTRSPRSLNRAKKGGGAGRVGPLHRSVGGPKVFN